MSYHAECHASGMYTGDSFWYSVKILYKESECDFKVSSKNGFFTTK